MAKITSTNPNEAQFTPPPGAAAAGKRALEMQKKGHKWGTSVGWKRASQLANKQKLSYNTVKRMKAYFDRHIVDKKGKDWNNKEKPSKGKLAWWGWGGDAGYSWAKGIVKSWEAKKNKEKAATTVEDGVYASFPVVNSRTIGDWIKSSLPKEVKFNPHDFHVTVCYSKKPITVADVPRGAPFIIPANNGRKLKLLGSAFVLAFTAAESKKLVAAWDSFRRAGATWDYPSYIPHMTIDPDSSLTLAQIKNLPVYNGPVVFGEMSIVPLKDS